MKLLADEGVDTLIVTRLRAEGHDLTYVAELAPNITDDAVLEPARAEERLLLTTDRDFGELVSRLRRVSTGVLLIRLAGHSPNAKAETVARAIAERGERMRGAFAVVSGGAVRIRAQGGR